MGHVDRFPWFCEVGYRPINNNGNAIWEELTRSIWEKMYALLARYPGYVIEGVRLPHEHRMPLQAQLVYLLNTRDCKTCPLKRKPCLNTFLKRAAAKLKGKQKVVMQN